MPGARPPAKGHFRFFKINIIYLADVPVPKVIE